MLPTGQLEVELRIELHSTPATLSDFYFVKSTPDGSIIFDVMNVWRSPNQCGLTSDGQKCVYTLNAVTRGSHASYTGKYEFDASYTRRPSSAA